MFDVFIDVSFFLFFFNYSSGGIRRSIGIEK